jgi:hypothetical protein
MAGIARGGVTVSEDKSMISGVPGTVLPLLTLSAEEVAGVLTVGAEEVAGVLNVDRSSGLIGDLDLEALTLVLCIQPLPAERGSEVLRPNRSMSGNARSWRPVLVDAAK